MAPSRLDQVVLSGKFVHEALKLAKVMLAGASEVDSVLGAVRCYLCLFFEKGHKVIQTRSQTF